MDILEILNGSIRSLYPEDLDFFEVELDTGDYDSAYIEQCREALERVRKKKKFNKSSKSSGSTPKKGAEGVFVNIDELAPKANNAVINNLTPKEIIFGEILKLREFSTYKSDFKKYVSKNDKIDSTFIDQNYSFFTDWEFSAIASVKQLDEDFLEKYFEVIDHDKIARYQNFSEAFFMKHYLELNTNIVLLQGKNDWRKKENRSRQLDVFLRLKGVKI